jgi:hypothetical protein
MLQRQRKPFKSGNTTHIHTIGRRKIRNRNKEIILLEVNIQTQRIFVALHR